MKNTLAFAWLIPIFVAAVVGVLLEETVWLTSMIILISFILLIRPVVVKQTSRRVLVLGLFLSLILAGFVSVVVSGQVPEYFESWGARG